MVDVAVWAAIGSALGVAFAGPPVLIWYLVGSMWLDARPVWAGVLALVAVAAGWLVTDVVGRPVAGPGIEPIGLLAATTAALLVRGLDRLVTAVAGAGSPR